MRTGVGAACTAATGTVAGALWRRVPAVAARVSVARVSAAARRIPRRRGVPVAVARVAAPVMAFPQGQGQ